MKKKVKKNKNRRARYCNKKSPKIKFSFIIDSDIKYSRANKRVISNENLKEYESVSLLMIFCGGLGNLIDRAFRGHVIDFLHFYYENYSFYVFNFADTYITVGVVIYLIGIIYQYNKQNEDQTS